MCADGASVSYKSGFRPPRGTTTLGVWLFLAALFMLFASAMIGYAIIRINSDTHLPLGDLHLPGLLWISTAVLLLVSFSIHRALVCIRHERQAACRRWLKVTLLAALAFLGVQAPAMVELLGSHHAMLARQTHGTKIGLYGLVFFLVILHALHVVGGLFWLVRITVQGHRGLYDHEDHQPIRHAAMYWHFIDIVWIIMFATFLVLR